jgi:hypothetical protein
VSSAAVDHLADIVLQPRHRIEMKPLKSISRAFLVIFGAMILAHKFGYVIGFAVGFLWYALVDTLDDPGGDRWKRE